MILDSKPFFLIKLKELFIDDKILGIVLHLLISLLKRKKKICHSNICKKL